MIRVYPAKSQKMFMLYILSQSQFYLKQEVTISSFNCCAIQLYLFQNSLTNSVGWFYAYFSLTFYLPYKVRLILYVRSCLWEMCHITLAMDSPVSCIMN